MYISSFNDDQVLAKLSLASILVRGISHQEKFSMDVGVTKPEGRYVYRATRIDTSIRQPYRPIQIEDAPTTIITPRHLDGMLAEIIQLHFGEKIEPLRLASDMNWELYKRLYQHLVKQ